MTEPEDPEFERLIRREVHRRYKEARAAVQELTVALARAQGRVMELECQLRTGAEMTELAERIVTEGTVGIVASSLQERAVSWHATRFPASQRRAVMLKAIAELGEVADAVLSEDSDDPAHRNTGDGVTGEAADVVIALLVLTGRWPGGDLMTAVARKLTILETPGAHRSSLLPDRSSQEQVALPVLDWYSHS